LKYPLRCFRKNTELASNHLFLGAEFSKLKVFDNAELERSYKNRSGAVLNTPLI
jgi:hypothetical protein